MAVVDARQQTLRRLTPLDLGMQRGGGGFEVSPRIGLVHAPDDLHGLLRHRPASISLLSSAAHLAELLGLSDEELLDVLGAEPLDALSGDLDDRREVTILLDLLADARERASDGVLRRWMRAAGPAGRPIDLLSAHDFAAFEDALATLEARGFVLRGGGGGA